MLSPCRIRSATPTQRRARALFNPTQRRQHGKRQRGRRVQLILFPDLIAPEICLWRPGIRRTRGRIAQSMSSVSRQLEMVFRVRDPIREDLDSPFDIPIQRRITADAAPPPEVRAPRSVWELASACIRAVRLHQSPEPAVRTRIVRDGSAVRCERIAVQDTPEYHEAERARRARQKPPKGRQIGWKKTRSDKLRGMIREETED